MYFFVFSYLPSLYTYIYIRLCVCVRESLKKFVVILCPFEEKKTKKLVWSTNKDVDQEAKKKKKKKKIRKDNQSNRIDNYIPCFFPMTSCYISVSSRNLGCCCF